VIYVRLSYVGEHAEQVDKLTGQRWRDVWMHGVPSVGDDLELHDGTGETVVGAVVRRVVWQLPLEPEDAIAHAGLPTVYVVCGKARP